MIEDQLRKLLAKYSHPFWLKADSRISESLIQAYLARGKNVVGDEVDLRSLSLFITLEIITLQQYIYDLRNHHVEFVSRFTRAIADREREQYILDYAEYLGASPADLEGDKEAFSRWFGSDAMTDRYLRRHTRAEHKMALYLRYIGNLTAEIMQQQGESLGHAILWHNLNLESMIQPLLAYDGDNRVNITAFNCLSTALKVLPKHLQQEVVSVSTTQYVYRSALESRQAVWIQCEALSLLQTLDPASLSAVLEKRLTNPQTGDDFFVRRRAVQILGENLKDFPDLVKLFLVIAKDPSPYVRQVLAGSISQAEHQDLIFWLRRLALQDECAQVKAAALLECVKNVTSADLFEPLLELLIAVLETEQDAFVLRVAFKVISDSQDKLSPELAGKWAQALQPPLAKLHSKAEQIGVRRWAAQTREQLWLRSQPEILAMARQLENELQRVEPGDGYKPSKEIDTIEEETFGRMLSVLGQKDFGYDVKTDLFQSRTITRGHRFGFRLWRFLHELRHPAPDKRQAFEHTIGRVFDGNIRASSAILSELAETKVPGEPLFIMEEGGWRPYLPLVDEVISSLDPVVAKPVRLFSSEGITEIIPPRSVHKRLMARVILNVKFTEFSRLRNWRESHQTEPVKYIQSLKRLGFEVTFRPYGDGDAALSEDPAVSRFFPAVAVVPVPDMWERIQHYFFSAYENSLFELTVFTAAAILIFSIRHVYQSRKIHKLRNNLPLVVGGWGTRGKSGTERIKAAMLNAMGYSLVSKTTGCEAMFLYADAYGKMHEMFLFRPYEKATIWEQYHVMNHAVGLHADIMLWECMALTPSYVKILQQHWVRDDISTITNTYPDHEDLQGPAGINIPEVMTNFIPKAGILLTTEEQMRPILSHAAAKQNTRFDSVGWLESGLLTPDVLARFPYEEHPDNIALVLRLAEELGIEQDFALKEMADRVVADLGVLKTYPVAKVNNRKLQFTNGMSANERFGCLSNWKRMEFDRQDFVTEPGVWITTLVNNRADRIARSRVFAGIIVNDISADQHVLIGSNLQGISGYIEEGWEVYAASLTLWPEAIPGQEAVSPEQVFMQFAKQFRVAFTPEIVTSRLRVMLSSLPDITDETIEMLCSHWQSIEILQEKIESWVNENDDGNVKDILLHHERNLEILGVYETFGSKLQKPEDRQNLDNEFRKILYQWFLQKIIVIEDYHATGDAIIKQIANMTPPGFFNRIMGMQNIKGTGLDFVYRWQAWNTCYEACAQMKNRSPTKIEQGLRTLSAFREYGLLSETHVRETVEQVKQSPHAQRESIQAELTMILSNLERAMLQVNAGMTVKQQTGWGAKLIGVLEAFLDAGDAVKRRKTADKIYKDLVDERISIGRAIQELQQLNKRQKGGWLIKWLKS
ncbi:MAG: HEAT repeat domain-containing protein [Burkholderiales bacterium]|nr:HEAT repeat domain-containing protein [Nitrosomonas sp.]MCP5276613.1 HEAT repeat domain-containing protein [Burkholderiales bacterium]